MRLVGWRFCVYIFGMAMHRFANPLRYQRIADAVLPSC